MSGRWRVEHGHCIEVMAAMPAASVDVVVCDPPYGLSGEPDVSEVLTHWLAGDDYAHRGGGFMGRSWDNFVPGPAYWRACLRVLKPGGHLLAFGGTRTYDLLAIAVRMAGFEIRDSIMWLYGSGFPKSLDVSKAIDKAAGAEREVVGTKLGRPGMARDGGNQAFRQWREAEGRQDVPSSPLDLTAPATGDAERWNGWGTALKPAHEPIVVARKPLGGTVAANVLEHGTGALNIDGCRIGTSKRVPGGISQEKPNATVYGTYGIENGDEGGHDPNLGRWPANVVLSHSPGCREVGTRKVRGDNRTTGNGTRPAGFANIGADAGDAEPNAAVYGDEEVSAWECVEGCVRLLDEQTGDLHSQDPATRLSISPVEGVTEFGTGAAVAYGDTGGASRFFYCPKADTSERNAGLSVASLFSPLDAPERNAHPTVKPIELMRWLVRLVTPPGGTVLDPFAGSGSTLCAAVLDGFDCIGIEREAEYVAICRARLAHWASGQAEAPSVV